MRMRPAAMHERRSSGGILIRSTFHFHCCCCDGGRKVGTLHPPTRRGRLREGGEEGGPEAYLYFFGRSPGRPLQEITSVRRVRRFIGRPTHSFSAGSVARKNSSNDGCGGGGGELACCMRRRFACQCLSIQTYSRPHCPSGIFGLPELHYYSFWHQIPLLLPPSFASRQTDGQPVWHLAVTSPRRRGQQPLPRSPMCR